MMPKSKTSRFFRGTGSLIFLFAGVGYIYFPPQTTASFFDAAWPAIVWGWVFAFGGLISLIGTLTEYVHFERFGVLCVVTAGFMLALAQFLVMAGPPFMPTRLGGTLVYFGLAVWALERWYRLGRDEHAINAVAHESKKR